MQLSQRNNINASPFEILTASAFHLFNEEKIDIGVIEVGMGGKLDATNILNNQVVSVISKIAKDHESFLGSTLEEIAKHKAGILRPNVPYIVNPKNEKIVQDVIDQYAQEIGAGPRLVVDPSELQSLFSSEKWHLLMEPLLPFQRDNATLAAIAAKEALKSIGITLTDDEAVEGITPRQERHLGRLQYQTVPPVFGHEGDHVAGQPILIDGAHNPDAARELERFVEKNERKKKVQEHEPPQDGGWPVTWVLAMTDGKDAKQYLEILLKPGDNLVATTFGPVSGMPWIKPMPPQALIDTAKFIQSNITAVAVSQPDPLRALSAAKHLSLSNSKTNCPIVLTGSLYLIGNFFKDMRTLQDPDFWSRSDSSLEWARVRIIDKEEELYVQEALNSGK